MRIQHGLLDTDSTADFTRNRYRYFWNQFKGRGLQAICEHALGDYQGKETRGRRRVKSVKQRVLASVNYPDMMSIGEAHFHAHVAVTHRLGIKRLRLATTPSFAKSLMNLNGRRKPC